MRQIFKNFYAFDDEKITRKPIYVIDGIISDKFQEDDKTQVIDCNGLVLLSSFADMHVHFRDPGFTYKEDLETGSKAALAGGYTTVNLMGNTKPTVSSPEVYEDIKKRAKELDLIDIEQVYTITKNFDGKTIDHLDNLPESVKFLSEDGHGVADDNLMFEVMQKCKKLGINLTLHEEVDKISKIDYEIAEDMMTIRDAYLSYKLDCPVHFSHVSTRGAIKAIEYFKNLGAPITCETTPHHIKFSDREDLRVNPPIRTEKDKKTIIEMIEKGVVDCIATDHAPHSEREKKQNAPGYIGLETAFSTSYEVLVKSGRISLNHLVKLMSTTPNKLLGYKKGKLDKGYEADFTLVDLDKEYVYRKEDIVSKSKNSLLVGEKLQGTIEKVYKKGVLKYENNR